MMTACSLNFLATGRKLHELAGAGVGAHDGPWIDEAHGLLGELADGLQEEIGDAENSRRQMAEINPDIGAAPVAQRRVEATRRRLIELREKALLLRADLRQQHAHLPLNLIQARARCRELAVELEAARQEQGRFLLETFNLNPGAGE